MCSFNRWNTEMTNFENYVCVCFVLCLCRDWFCGLTWQKLYIWEVLKCTFAYDMVWLSLGDPLWLTWCWNPITNFCAVVSVNVGPWSAQWSVLLSGPGLCSGQCCCQALVCAVVSVAVRPWSVQWSLLLSGPDLRSGQCCCQDLVCAVVSVTVGPSGGYVLEFGQES